MNTPKGLFYERGKRLNFLGGQKARDWRRDAARFSTRPGDYLRTLKFKLQPEQPIRFEDAAKLYEITEGIAPGSLYYLLMTVHLTGFRLFQKKAGATLFKASRGFPEAEFRAALIAQANADPRDLTISALFDKFGGGAPKPYTAEKLIKDLTRMVTGANPREPLANSPLKALLESFASEVLAQFPSWPKKQDLPKLFQLFDNCAAEQGLNLPKLAGCVVVLAKDDGKGPQIAYDPALMTLEGPCEDNELIHLACAQKLQVLRRMGESDPASKLKVEIVSFQTNALSWLFNVGLKWLKQATVEEIETTLALPGPAGVQAVKLKEAAKAIPADALFGAESFENFRTSVAQKITSWISNYLNRLKVLREILEAADLSPSSIPEWIKDPVAGEVLERLGFEPSTLEEVMQALRSLQADTLQALDRLEGRVDSLPSSDDIKAVERFSAKVDGLSGVLRQASKELEDGDSKRRTLPGWARSLPRLPRISGGLPDLETEVSEIQASYVGNLRKYRATTERLLSNAQRNGQLGDPIIKHALSLVASQGEAEPQVANALSAKLMLIQRLTNLAARSADETKQLIADGLKPLFVEPKDCNKRIFNRLGSVFRHPRSTSRHQPFPTHDDRVLDLDLEGFLERLIADLGSLRDERLIRDKIALEQFLNTFRMSGLPDDIPRGWVSLKEIDEDLGLPANLAMYADLPAAPRAAVQRAINLYATGAMAAFSKLSRKRFFIRTKFMRIGKNALHWVPKKKPWRPAAHMLTDGNSIWDALATGLLPQTEDGYEVWKGISSLARGTNGQASLSPRERLTLLQQSPHDWYLDLGLAGCESSNREGISVGKEGVGSKAETLLAPARLVGPSSSKQWLLRTMENRDLVASGEYMLLIAQHYEQKVAWSNETPKITITPQEVALELALPITDKRPGTEPAHHPFSQAVIGIDLGEAGIGYAAFSAAELLARDIQEEGMPAPIASGSIPIPSVRRLIKAVKRFRGTTQRTQSFREGNNTALQKLRDNVVGDVLATIDTLCARLRGFPVLESSVVNLSSGAKQLALVYDRVVHSYCYSDIDAHKAAREHHWAAANNWDHPYLERTKKVQRKDGTWVPGKHEKLKLFPGVSVHPAGTSQRCHKCGRNAIQDVRDTYGEGSRNLVSVKEGGIVSCGQGNLVLRTDAPEAEQRASRNTKRLPIGGRSFTEQSELARARGKDNRRRKERSLRTHPMIPQNISADRLRQLVRSQLRQGQASLRSRDTTQSQFFCPYEGCHYVGHADENASINIVWKWCTEGDVRSKTIGGQ